MIGLGFFFSNKADVKFNHLEYWLLRLRSQHFPSVCILLCPGSHSGMAFCSLLITSFSSFFQPDSLSPTELSPAAPFTSLFFFLKVRCCHLSLAQKCTFRHTQSKTHAQSGLTPDSGLIWSSVFTTTAHLELTLQVPSILLRYFLKDLPWYTISHLASSL